MKYWRRGAIASVLLLVGCAKEEIATPELPAANPKPAPAAAKQELKIKPVPSRDMKVLFDFDRGFDLTTVEARSVKTKLVNTTRQTPNTEHPIPNTGLHLSFAHDQDWPGITLKAPKDKWDLSRRNELVLDVKNPGKNTLSINCRVDTPGADGSKNCVTGNLQLEPGESGEMRIALPSSAYKVPEPIVGMRGVPGGTGKIDTSNVTQLLLFVGKPTEDHVAVIDNIRAEGHVQPVDVKEFFPFIDELGQFIHKDWPGKTKGIEDLQRQKKVEAADIAANPRPANWNKWGGWAKGPQLNATGYFRAEKYKKKWWLVDPDGRLFWSHGIDCVNLWAATPISHREKYFKNLPKEGSEFAQFYGTGKWAPHGFYKDKTPYKHYNYRAANLLRKYGKDWKQAFSAVTHKRISSWSMNSLGNWSSADVYLQRKTPYTVAVHFGGPVIEGNKGFWHKFHDPFDPGFRTTLQKRMAREKGKAANDPWCIGFFVENELSWGKDLSLAQASLASPAKQAAKKVFIADLKKKYGQIATLNAKWKTNHASWAALLQSSVVPKGKGANDDLRAFAERIANEYFRIVREEVKRVAPKNMYLGCRFAWANDVAVNAAAKYCDVVSYNFYREEISKFKLPLGLDKPVIVGEFHFGALDRGMFHTGLRKAKDQKERAWKYTRYVTGAVKNPQIVGTHWFQYGDQATTGRGDGENYQIGFIDICDTPYKETIEAARAVGKKMYDLRYGAGK